MTEAIIVAAFSLLGTLAGAYFSNKKSAALISYRLDQLEQTVAKHNSLVERMYNLEKREDVIEEKMKVVNHRIEDLEHDA